MLNTVETVLQSDFAIAIRDWGAWGIALLALWISYSQYRATTAEKLPNLRVLRLRQNRGLYALTFSLQNYSDKPLVIDRVEVKGGGPVLYGDAWIYDAVTGKNEITGYNQTQPSIATTVPPAGTPESEWQTGDNYQRTLNFKTGVASSLKFVVHYRIGHEAAKLRKISAKRDVKIEA